MSKYTTEVRFICESYSGLESSTGADNIDMVLASAWNKIFTSNVSFFDEEYRSVLCQKILKHYYLREICCETVGVWKLWMNERLEMIMPFYNQLYESARLDFNPLYDVDITRKRDGSVVGNTSDNGETTETDSSSRETSGTSENVQSGSSKNTSEASSNATNKNLYSDTPQGAITGLENENYLTNARKVTDAVESSAEDNGSTTGTSSGEYSENVSTSDTRSGTTKNTGTSNTVEDYLETVTGKQGSGSYSKMLLEFRETLLNIDQMVIDEFSDLFFGLW